MNDVASLDGSGGLVADHLGPVTPATDQSWSQYVTFAVNGCAYGVEITKVREIKGWSEPTELPNAPHAMRGVLNLRGVVVPVFDLREQFGQGKTDAREEHVVIIVTLGERLIGVLVDSVSDILTLELQDILPVPPMERGERQRYLAGLVSREEGLVALLKLEELFGDESIPADICM